jgi:L-arabinose isomerase
MLDVTMDYDFGQSVSPDRIMYNHGVHGVQDLASMLRRRKYPFEIVAGHVTQSPALERTAGLARAAYAARVLNSVTALRIGPVFKGMGDFQVQDQVMLERLGVRCVEVDLDTLEAAAGAVDEASVTAEIKADLERFAGEVPEDVHRATNRVGLGVRRLLDEHGALAFSVNFLAFDRSEGAACTVPFLEACKAMSRGLGYAGEGDLLTAALIAALNQAFGGTTFTEIFCPDWQGESLFLSHMGEINPDVSAVPAVLMEKPYPFSAARNPAVITAAPRPGPATLVNLAPGPDDTFTLIVAPVEVLEDTEAADLQAAVRGWIQPECEVAQFLENYSRLGGTHHSALMLGYRVEVLRAFAGFTGMGFAVIE